MRLFSEILNLFHTEMGTGIQYTVLEGKGGYFQNVRRIQEFSAERIVLKGAGSLVLIEGENLSLGKYFEGDLSVKGDIRRIGREKI